MIIAVPKETYPGERRVALSPDAAGKLVKGGHEVHIEAGAGLAAGFRDAAYLAKGVIVSEDRAELFKKADVVCQVQTPGANPEAGQADIEALRAGQVLVGCADPLSAGPGLTALAERKVKLFALELIPRTTRAQSMDVLSSQANLAGYRATLLAAMHLPQAFPMYMTAAGTVKPARVFVIGAGVAGLQAIATARRLGAVVNAYDVRPACREQVESLGAKFVEIAIETKDAEDKGGYAKAQSEDQLKRQQELMARVVADSDAVITTAAIPGRKAPILVTEAMVKSMKPGSVIIDLAAERGGNCEGCEAGEVVVKHGVTIVGPRNLPADIARDASQMFGNNVASFLKLLADREGKLVIDMDDDIIAGTLVCDGGEVVHPRVRQAMGLATEDAKVKEGSAA